MSETFQHKDKFVIADCYLVQDVTDQLLVFEFGQEQQMLKVIRERFGGDMGPENKVMAGKLIDGDRSMFSPPPFLPSLVLQHGGVVNKIYLAKKYKKE